MKHILTITVAAAMIAGAAWAQRPGPGHGPRGEQFAALQEYLGLTEDQVTAIREINQTLHETVRGIMEGAQTTLEALREELNQENPNPAIVGQYVVDLQDVRDDVKAARDAAREETTALLDDTQKAKLAALQEAMALVPLGRAAAGANLIEGPEHDGPGGMMGGGPGAGMFGPGPGGDSTQFGPGQGRRGGQGFGGQGRGGHPRFGGGPNSQPPVQ